MTTSQDISAAYARAWHVRARRFTMGRVVRIACLFAIGFTGAIAAAVTAPMVIGFHSLAVLSGSMEPTIGTGDVVVVKTISPLDAKVGDVVTFSDPENAARLLSHRITQMHVTAAEVAFVTKGDANTGVERWKIARSGTIGKVEYHVPKLGYVTNRLGSRFGRLGFLVIPALLLALLEVRRIWSPAEEGPDDAVDR